MTNPRDKYRGRASVTIRYDAGSGEIVLSEDPIFIRRRGRIDWQCDDGDWTITVEDADTPFDEGREVRGGRGQRAGVRVRNDAHQGQPDGRRYKYTVAVDIGDETVQRDPEVVVGPEDPPDDDD